MYLREYDFECAVSMGKDERGQNDPTYRQRAVTLLREYQRALLHLKTGDKLEFGSYFLSNGVKPIKTFVRSPIVWQVLDKTDNRLLLLSEHSLDWELFGDVGACSWEASYLRKWLNSDCLRDWFAEEERAPMQTKICPPEKRAFRRERHGEHGGLAVSVELRRGAAILQRQRPRQGLEIRQAPSV